MDWKMVLHNDQNFVEIMTSGIADKEGSLAMARTLTEIMRINKINKALIDHSKLEDIEGKNIDVFKRPRLMKIIGAVLRIRIAEIIRPEHRKHFEFLETVFQSQGFKFQVFQEREEAMQWLFQEGK